MMFRAFSLKNILSGILLGLMVVGVWVYYPVLMDRFRFSAPQVKKKITTFLRDQERRVSSYAEKIPVDSDEKEKAPISSLSEDEKGPDAAYDEPAHEDPYENTKVDKGIEAYYASEESRWQELIGKSIHPDHVDSYPYHECFKAGASEHKLPLSVVLGLAAQLSNFNPDSFMDRKAGVMHLGWPDPSQGMGVYEREALIKDPCMNIKLACRFLADLLAQNNNEWVPGLVAYRDQVNAVRRDKITIEDLAFSARLRGQVDKVLQGPFEKMIMHPFLAFSNREIAEKFMAIIRASTGIDLWLGQKGYQYTVFIPAGDESEKEHKKLLISKHAGINGENNSKRNQRDHADEKAPGF